MITTKFTNNTTRFLCLISVVFLVTQHVAMADCTYKEITYGNFAADDCLQSTGVTRGALFGLDSACSEAICYGVKHSNNTSGNFDLAVYSCDTCGGGGVKLLLKDFDSTKLIAAMNSIYCTNQQLTDMLEKFYTCETCPGGTYYDSSSYSCKTCTGNTFSVGGTVTSCTSCPSGQTANSSHTRCDCPAGYYKNNTSCVQCPLADGIYTNSARTTLARYTSTAGATSKNDCYLASGTTYYNTKGTFTFDTKCNYE